MWSGCESRVVGSVLSMWGTLLFSCSKGLSPMGVQFCGRAEAVCAQSPMFECCSVGTELFRMQHAILSRQLLITSGVRRFTGIPVVRQSTNMHTYIPQLTESA